MSLLKATLPQKDYDEFVAELTSKIKEVQKLKEEDLQYPKNLTRRKGKVTNTKGAWNNNSNAKKILLEELSFNASAETDYNFNDYKINTENILNLSGDWAAEKDKKIAAELKIELIEAIDEFNNIMAQIIPIEVEKFIELTKEELSKLKVGELSTDAKNPKKPKTTTGFKGQDAEERKSRAEYLYPKGSGVLRGELESLGLPVSKEMLAFLNADGSSSLDIDSSENKDKGKTPRKFAFVQLDMMFDRLKKEIDESMNTKKAKEKINSITNELGLSNVIEGESESSLDKWKKEISVKIRPQTLSNAERLTKRLIKYEMQFLHENKTTNVHDLLGETSIERKQTLSYLMSIHENAEKIMETDLVGSKEDQTIRFLRVVDQRNKKYMSDEEQALASANKYTKDYLGYDELLERGRLMHEILNNSYMNVTEEEKKTHEKLINYTSESIISRVDFFDMTGSDISDEEERETRHKKLVSEYTDEPIMNIIIKDGKSKARLTILPPKLVNRIRKKRSGLRQWLAGKKAKKVNGSEEE